MSKLREFLIELAGFACPSNLWYMNPTRHESYINLDGRDGDACFGWHGEEHINPLYGRKGTRKRVRFNDQVQFILPAHVDEVWEQDDTALVQTWTKIHSPVVGAIKQLLGDVSGVQVVV